MAAKRDFGLIRRNRRDNRYQRRQNNGRNHKNCPCLGHIRWQYPADNERKNGQRRRQGAAQIIQHFPFADDWNRAFCHARCSSANIAEQPWQQLPVAARPAVMAHGAHIITRRKFLNNFNICGQSGPHKNAFKQIVAQQR